MSTLKAYVLEDEVPNRDMLISSLQQMFPDIEVVGIADNLDQAEKDFSNIDFDLAFLDIKVKGKNVFSLLERFEKLGFDIIFTTAYSEYAIKAFQLSAIDYLLKPYTPDQLRSAVEKVIEKKGSAQNIGALMENIKKLNKLAIPEPAGFRFVELEQVIYMQAERNYTDIFLSNGSKCTSTKNILYYEEMLKEENFYRIHHSYMVNLTHVLSINSKRMEVDVDLGMSLPISHRKKSAFVKELSKLSYM